MKPGGTDRIVVGLQRGVFLSALLACTCLAEALEFDFTTGAGGLVLSQPEAPSSILIETNHDPAVLRATRDLAQDFAQVTQRKPTIIETVHDAGEIKIIVGTLGRSPLLKRLVAEGKVVTNGITGAWETYSLQIVTRPLPQVDRALVIVGSDARGTIYGVYDVSGRIGVSPWYWWADVPVARRESIAVRGDAINSGPPAVKYRGIFINDEDWGLQPWAAKNFEPETGDIGPKTYAKIFELLLRLRANYIWPAMHPCTKAFNLYPENKRVAANYGIVMGSSHCEQMLRNNISEWDERQYGAYNFVTNPDGVLRYWEERVRENGRFDNIYTLGMRGVHDSGMPGGGTTREKAARLHAIIEAQRKLLAQWVTPEVDQVPQIFCPYKEVLELYRLEPDIPEDITLVWPDDNYGYIRQFSSAQEGRRSGGAGVYYHLSYWGAPRDYLWLCTTPPALIAEEMCKAFDYGANRVWVVNVGDIKPAEIDLEFFLQLAWQPSVWLGTNTYDLITPRLARDFGSAHAHELTKMLAEFYRLNFQRKPEHITFPSSDLFSASETQVRLEAWRQLVARVDAASARLAPEYQDAFFELFTYPIKAAAAMNRKCLANSDQAAVEIVTLTRHYNNELAGGKWRGIISDNPRKQLDLPRRVGARTTTNKAAAKTSTPVLVVEAEDASECIPGVDAQWRRVEGLGYNGEALTVFPTTVSVRSNAIAILAESPCAQFRVTLETAGAWQATVRALPTFSIEAGKPQRYAIAFDDAAPQIVALPTGRNERDLVWQQNVLRNGASATSTHRVGVPGVHTLKIWMVDPGIVLDAIALTPAQQDLSYTWQ